MSLGTLCSCVGDFCVFQCCFSPFSKSIVMAIDDMNAKFFDHKTVTWTNHKEFVRAEASHEANLYRCNQS